MMCYYKLSYLAVFKVVTLVPYLASVLSVISVDLPANT